MEDKKSTLITAHSGSDGTPDNSMEFENYALGTAVDALEIDVRQAADGTLIISHDETGEEAVTLKEVFDAVRGHGKRINCDLKEYGLEEAVNELAVSCGLAEGQILFSGSGVKTAIFCKFRQEDVKLEERFDGISADLYWAASEATCSIRNQYFTADKERRQCTSLGVCDPFRFEELPQVKTDVYHFAGLVYGDFDGEILEKAASEGQGCSGCPVHAETCGG